jgi:uncharacterized protein YyaL (SSP411 family)
MTEKTNRLGKEKSPYLLQHRDNPVHWYAWGEEAFRAARKENKPIFLSIGYSTCHWCHVMAHESFESDDVAALLNKNFISIKLDREERPDVDDLYMSAIHAMGQRGGWPLSMFLTPELKPFYGGTYWPREHFLNILQQLSRLWVEDRPRVENSGESLLLHLREQKAADFGMGQLNDEVFSAFYRNSLVNFDRRWGGFGGAPKFPHAMQLSMLLRIHRRTRDNDALQMTVHTLDKMARGGLYDHLGGGFARYSTDAQWLIPHFEKMLYDNALLAVAYLEAFQVTGIEMFERVARETLDYVLSVMTHPEGGFYSAEDADSEGEEGKFYVWKYEELKRRLTAEEFEHFSKVYNVTEGGNFEGATNHLNLNEEYGWDEKDHPALKSAREKLFKVREARVHPHKDDKVLTAWNGLMIHAMAKGFCVTGRPEYLQAAHAAASFIKRHLFKQGELLARYRDGEGKFSARLDDYAFLVQGLLELYQCDFNPEVLAWAAELQKIQDAVFWDQARGGYFFTDGRDKDLLIRSKEGMDGALPNGNGMSALNLLKLYGLMGEGAYLDRAKSTLQAFSQMVAEYPQAFSQMVIAYDYLSDLSKELAVLKGTTDGVEDFLKELRNSFQPNLVLAAGPSGQNFPPLLANRTAVDGKTTFYVCEGQTCQSPTHDAERALQVVGTSRPYVLN